MFIHSAIAALRSERSDQADMQLQFKKLQEEWAAHPITQAISEDLQDYADGTALEDCPKLDRLMSDPMASHQFFQRWQRDMIAALLEYPLGVPTFRHRCSDGLSNIALLIKDNATLSITAYEERSDAKEPLSAVFSDCQTHEVVLSGSANGVLHEIRQCDGLDRIIDTCSTHWRPGAAIATNGPCEARQVVSVKGAMVVLHLSRRAPNPQPTREYLLENGELLQIASGDKLASQKVMALSVLGAMATGADARHVVDAMATCVRDLVEDGDVRWEAVRQTLAVNPAQGIALLEEIVARENDPLVLPALHLRDALRSDQPDLAHLFGTFG